MGKVTPGDGDAHHPRLLRDPRGTHLGHEVLGRAVGEADPLLGVAGARDQGGGATTGGDQRLLGQQGRPREADVRRQHGAGLRLEHHHVVSGFHLGLDLDVGLEVTPAAQLVDDGRARLVDRFFLEERAGHLGVDVRRVVHPLDPPAMAHARHAREDGDVVVEAGVHDRLQVALVREVLAEPIRVVEEVPVGDLLARPRLGRGEEVRELGQLALELHVAELHRRVGGGRPGRPGRPSEVQPLAGRVLIAAVEAPLELEGDLLSEPDPVLHLVVLLLGIAQAVRVDEAEGRRELLAEGEARGRVALAGEELGLDVHLVDAEVDELAGHRAREASEEQRPRLLAHDPAAAGQGHVGGQDAGELLGAGVLAVGDGDDLRGDRPLGGHGVDAREDRLDVEHRDGRERGDGHRTLSVRDANQAAACPPLMGLARLKPWRYVAPRRASSVACSSVSTPSATVQRLSVAARAMTAEAIWSCA